MNNNFNQIELFKNFLTGFSPDIQKTNGLKINDNIRLIEENQPKGEIVTLVLMYDENQKKEKVSKKNVGYPFLCDI